MTTHLHDAALHWREEWRPVLRDQVLNDPNRFELLDPEAARSELFPRVFWCHSASRPVRQGATDPTLAAFAAEISQQVDSFLFDQIAGSGSSATFVSEVLIPQAMRSLRDVDEPIEIELDSYGTDWANRISSRTGGP